MQWSFGLFLVDLADRTLGVDQLLWFESSRDCCIIHPLLFSGKSELAADEGCFLFGTSVQIRNFLDIGTFYFDIT